MGITYKQEEQTFYLQSKNSSYALTILKTGHLGHLYWGRKIDSNRSLTHLIKPKKRALEPYLIPEENEDFTVDKSFSLDMIPQEYPAYGRTDYRYPVYQVQQETGSRITDLKYKSHTIKPGKEPLSGLPATYVEAKSEAETLEITLEDKQINLQVVLSYTVYAELDVVTRSVEFINQGAEDLTLQQALSASVPFRDAEFELLQLSGAWARERHVKRRSLEQGTQSIESKRGASGPYQNPFLGLVRPSTTEHQGEAYGFSLVYSGNFLARTEVNHFAQTRVTMGINPFDFSWLLKPGEQFQTPEVVMVYSDQGINQLSQTYHQLYRTRLARGKYRDKERPILINNWEATYFDFDEEKLLDLAKTASDLGIELFVLDDGWFGNRNDDTSSLGDWFVDENKLPHGLEQLGSKIEDLGLKFGLWWEPEMVSPDSELYRKHPDWCLHVPNRSRSEWRNQLVLDFSRSEVRKTILERMKAVLEKAPISYIKWDMNRHMTEIGSQSLSVSRQQETAHRYILGLYQVLEELTTEFPDILFESCASGGGRFDPGMLYYMPQTWTSDNTDAVERLKIQYGTSIVYPLSSMGAHVSAVPNHQVGRITSLRMRGDVAKFGNFGYELDLTELSAAKKEEIKTQIAEYKEIRQLIQKGKFYRLMSPFQQQTKETAWMVVNQDKTEAYVGYFKGLAEPNPGYPYLQLAGLTPDKNYQVIGTEKIYGGDELMYAGLNLPSGFNGIDSAHHNQQGDFQSYVWHLKTV